MFVSAMALRWADYALWRDERLISRRRQGAVALLLS